MITAIADDITGAAEIAGVCLRLGIPVSFSLDVKPVDKGVLVVATDTRSLNAEEAVKETKALAQKLLETGTQHVFKKTDSVLRGHVAEELEAMAKVFEKDKIVLAPANPYTARTIRNGEYFVKGKPLDQTDFSDDPEFPASSSLIRKLVHPVELPVHIGDFSGEGGWQKGISIPDSANMDDLIALARHIDEEVVPAGSGAFFEAYLRTNFEHLCGTAPQQKNNHPMEGDGLLVAGSNHFQTHDFIKNALANGIKVCEMPKMLKIQEIHHGKLGDWITDVKFLLENFGKVILTLGKIQVRFDNCSHILKERMAYTVVRAIQEQGIQELLVSGGATVYAIISKLNWREFVPLEELSPGVVRLREQSTGCYLTIKPGSYDWPDEIISFFDMACDRV